jgi:hypothetical protein
MHQDHKSGTRRLPELRLLRQDRRMPVNLQELALYLPRSDANKCKVRYGDRHNCTIG